MGLPIGSLYVRRSIFINAAPARVWQEFVDFSHLDQWFGLGHKLEVFTPVVGDEVRVSIEGGSRAFGGVLLVFDATQEISFENNWYGDGAWPVPTFITIRLTGLYAGTQVEIFHHGFERLGSDAADNLQAYEKGWGMNHLEALRKIVET
jgi:uncharacterized protein YndB with AHSA1/START domain